MSRYADLFKTLKFSCKECYKFISKQKKYCYGRKRKSWNLHSNRSIKLKKIESFLSIWTKFLESQFAAILNKSYLQSIDLPLQLIQRESAGVHHPAAGPINLTTTQRIIKPTIPYQLALMLSLSKVSLCLIVKGSHSNNLGDSSDLDLGLFFLGARPNDFLLFASPIFKDISWIIT